MISTGNGVIFGQDAVGDLWWHKDLAQDGTIRWANYGVAEESRSGFRPGSFTAVFSGGVNADGDGVIHAIDSERRTPPLQSAGARRLNPDTQQVTGSVRRTIRFRAVSGCNAKALKGIRGSISRTLTPHLRESHFSWIAPAAAR